MQSLAENRAVVLPTIAPAEVASALSRGTERLDLARRWVRGLRGLPNLHLVAVDPGLAEGAASLAADQGLRGCDVVYGAPGPSAPGQAHTFDRRQPTGALPDILSRTAAAELVAG